MGGWHGARCRMGGGMGRMHSGGSTGQWVLIVTYCPMLGAGEKGGGVKRCGAGHRVIGWRMDGHGAAAVWGTG